jgi:uncharacterized protein
MLGEFMNLENWEKLFEERICQSQGADDPAHDVLHVKRVVSMARKLCEKEKANIEVVLPAAWLHDFIIVPKDSPIRKQASRLSAEAAIEFLGNIHYPKKHFGEIFHAIEAHSFSANIETKTLEAKIVQDADRLDGLGAIGIARCFATAGILKRSFYSALDPFCQTRHPDDSSFTVDHFFKKLFCTSETLQTAAGKQEGQYRAQFMQKFLQSLASEIAEK